MEAGKYWSENQVTSGSLRRTAPAGSTGALGLSTATCAAARGSFGFLLAASAAGRTTASTFRSSGYSRLSRVMLATSGNLAASRGPLSRAIRTLVVGSDLGAPGTIDIAGQEARSRHQSSNNNHAENQILRKKQLHVCPPIRLPTTINRTLLHKPQYLRACHSILSTRVAGSNTNPRPISGFKCLRNRLTASPHLMYSGLFKKIEAEA